MKSATDPEKLKNLTQCLKAVGDKRDIEAFNTLFDHYMPLIRAYSLAREPGAALLADELAQEVMIKLWEKAHLYKAELANPNTWIFTLARNCRIDYLRKKGRYVSEIDPNTLFDQMEDEGPSLFTQTQQQRSEKSIHEGLRKLPEEQAEVLRKVYLEGKSHQQASEDLDLPLGTVKSRIRLALRKLEVMVRR